MSTPILPFAVWQSGTNQNSIPANDNSLRSQILNGLVIGTANDEAGGVADGDIYIVGSAPDGAFASFDEFDLAIFMGGNWYAFAPVQGVCVNIAGALNQWNGSAYVAVTTGGGTDNVTVITESSAFTATPATHAGRSRLIESGGDVTFNVAEGYSSGDVFNIVATSGLYILTTGVTLTPPHGGTLDLDADMAVSVVMTGASAGRLIGQTVQAS